MILFSEKCFITDVDGAIGDCTRAAAEIKLEKAYERYKNSPARIVLEELPEMGMGLMRTMNYLARNFDVYPGVKETLETFGDRGYELCFCTDNPIFSVEENKDVLLEKVLGRKVDEYANEVFTSLIAEKGPEPKIKMNGSKVEYIEKKLRKAKKGILVVDDKNDFESAAYAKGLHNVMNIKVKRNCARLFNGCVDLYLDNFSDITKNEIVSERFLN